jgi:NAD(P)-dependent dehydrogenase (short-subunit alcohol dehydrogenase family)
VAFTFAEAGVKGILFADLDPAAAAQASSQSRTLATNPQYRCLSCQVDVTDVKSVDAMADLAFKEFGRIDYCINAFGVRIC